MSTDALKGTYDRETTARESEPREAFHFHGLCAFLTDDMAADQAENAAFHCDELAHTAGSFSGDNVWGVAFMSSEGRPPSTDENLWVLGVEVGLKPWL